MTVQIKTGITDLDSQLIDGLTRKELTYVLAPPTNYKTVFGVSLAYDTAIKQKLNTLYFNFESNDVAKNEWFLRRHAFELGTPIASSSGNTLKVSTNNDIFRDFYNKTQDRLYVSSEQDADIESFPKEINIFTTECKNRNSTIDVIVFDYIQLTKYGSGIETTVKFLKGMAEVLDCAVVVLGSMNRPESVEFTRNGYYVSELDNSMGTIVLLEKSNSDVFIRVVKHNNTVVTNPRILAYGDGKNSYVGNALNTPVEA